MSIYAPATLYLSSDGSSFEIKKRGEGEVHPTVKQAAECRTLEAVLDILHRLGEEPEGLSTVILMHRNNLAYPGHHFGKAGAIHPDNIAELKEFVADRLRDVEEQRWSCGLGCLNYSLPGETCIFM